MIDAYLAEVELSIFLCCDALDLDEGGVGAGVTLGALVAEDTSLGVESVRRKDEHGLDLSPGTTSSRLHAAHPSHSNESIAFVTSGICKGDTGIQWDVVLTLLSPFLPSRSLPPCRSR